MGSWIVESSTEATTDQHVYKQTPVLTNNFCLLKISEPCTQGYFGFGKMWSLLIKNVYWKTSTILEQGVVGVTIYYKQKENKMGS